jgi:hypothetical protein
MISSDALTAAKIKNGKPFEVTNLSPDNPLEQSFPGRHFCNPVHEQIYLLAIISPKVVKR